MLGEEHAYSLWSLIDVSKVVCDRGRAEEAATMLEEIYPVITRTLGEHHGQTYNAKLAIARAYARCNRRNESATLLKEVTLAVPEDFPMWLHAMLGYIHVLTSLDQPAELEEQCNRTISTIQARKLIRMDDPRTLEVARILLRMYRNQKREEDTQELLKRIPGLDELRRTETGLLQMIYGASAYDGKNRVNVPIW